MADGDVNNYYALLGIDMTATSEEVRRAYGERVREAMEAHDRERFSLLQEAFEVLKDFDKRSQYDRDLQASFAARRTTPAAPPPPVQQPVAPPVSAPVMPTIGTPPSAIPAAAAGNPPMGGHAPMDSTAQMGGGSATMAPPSIASPVAASVPGNGGGSFQLPTVCPMEVSPCPLLTGAVQPDEGFCPECGFMLGSALGMMAQMRPLPKLVDVQGREFPLKRGENLVGRAGEVDVLVPHQTISKRHARLVVEDNGRITLEDLQSTNGTKVGGVNIPANQRTGVADRTPLQFGAVKLTLIVPEPEEVAALPAPEADQQPAAIAAPEGSNSAARLVAASGEVFVLTSARTTFGRRPGNTVVITNDSYISGSHAEIVYREDRFILTDLGSTNGTRLNGQRVEPNQPYPLADGDAVSFGQTAFTFRGPSGR